MNSITTVDFAENGLPNERPLTFDEIAELNDDRLLLDLPAEPVSESSVTEPSSHELFCSRKAMRPRCVLTIFLRSTITVPLL